MICTGLCTGLLSVYVGDGLRRSKEIVKKSRTAPMNAVIIVIIIIFILIIIEINVSGVKPLAMLSYVLRKDYKNL